MGPSTVGAVTGAPPIVFLDANVLFSMALGGPVFELVLELGDGPVRLITSVRCKAEAELNLERKHPGSSPRLAEVLARVEVLPWSGEPDPSAIALVGEGDAHVLGAALGLGAAMLVTGDVRDFGSLMERDDLGIKVRSPRSFLLEGPPA